MSEYISRERGRGHKVQVFGEFFNKLTLGANYTSDQPFIIDIAEGGLNPNFHKLVIKTSGDSNTRRIEITRLSSKGFGDKPRVSEMILIFQNNRWSFEKWPSAGDEALLLHYMEAEEAHGT